MQRVRLTLVALAALATLGAAVWPATRRFAARQWSYVLPVGRRDSVPVTPGDPLSRSRRAEMYRRAAENRPEIPALQVAAVLRGKDPAVAALMMESPDAGRAADLKMLTFQFPDEPAVYAAYIRYASVDASRKGERPEARTAGSETVNEAGPMLPEILSAARAGERLDPDNAFFPAMRAAMLQRAGRTGNALAALRATRDDTRWTDYGGEVLQAMNGVDAGTSLLAETLAATERTALEAAIDYPAKAALFAAGREAVRAAVAAEEAGRPAEGLAIRRTVMHLGALMRAQDRTALGALTGVRLVEAATAPEITDQCGRPYQEHRAALLARLERADGANPREWAARQFAANDRTRAILRAATGRKGMVAVLSAGVAYWTGTALLLANALMLLAFAATAAVAGRFPAVRTGRPLSPPEWWGALGAVVLTAAVVALAVTLPVFMSLLALAAAASVAWWARRERAAGWRALGAAVAALSPIAVMLAWQGGAFTVPALGARSALSDVTERGSVALGGLLVPLLLVVALALGSRLRRSGRTPVVPGVLSGLRRSALPAAAILFLAWAALAPTTARHTERLRDALTATATHEGRFMARITGQTWPE